MENKKLKPVLLYDQEALKLVQARANKEKRSMSNAAAVTIIESLGSKK